YSQTSKFMHSGSYSLDNGGINLRLFSAIPSLVSDWNIRNLFLNHPCLLSEHHRMAEEKERIQP
ncbi:hypothetical protein, partial [Bacteroides acidifaciens]|uniref:hypothetical protein n=1 Tax=Bacteroides acidifaciens TaxID=85831 RepID=UPI003013F9CA